MLQQSTPEYCIHLRLFAFYLAALVMRFLALYASFCYRGVVQNLCVVVVWVSIALYVLFLYHPGVFYFASTVH